MPVWKAIIDWNLGHRFMIQVNSHVDWHWTNVTNVQLYLGKDENSSKDDGPLLKKSPDNKIALIIPPCFLSPLIKSRLKKSKWVSFYWSVMKKWKTKTNFIYEFWLLWVDVLNLFPAFVLISIIWRTLENHNTVAMLWNVGGSLFLKWHVYRPSLDNKHQL